jgi:hypothetical protein
MCANMLRAFQVGKALTSDGGPSSWMRPSLVAWAQVSWPACHLTKASASAPEKSVAAASQPRHAVLRHFERRSHVRR